MTLVMGHTSRVSSPEKISNFKLHPVYNSYIIADYPIVASPKKQSLFRSKSSRMPGPILRIFSKEFIGLFATSPPRIVRVYQSSTSVQAGIPEKLLIEQLRKHINKVC